jgi:hypothetical protein
VYGTSPPLGASNQYDRCGPHHRPGRMECDTSFWFSLSPSPPIHGCAVSAQALPTPAPAASRSISGTTTAAYQQLCGMKATSSSPYPSPLHPVGPTPAPGRPSDRWRPQASLPQQERTCSTPPRTSPPAVRMDGFRSISPPPSGTAGHRSAEFLELLSQLRRWSESGLACDPEGAELINQYGERGRTRSWTSSRRG